MMIGKQRVPDFKQRETETDFLTRTGLFEVLFEFNGSELLTEANVSSVSWTM